MHNLYNHICSNLAVFLCLQHSIGSPIALLLKQSPLACITGPAYLSKCSSPILSRLSTPVMKTTIPQTYYAAPFLLIFATLTSFAEKTLLPTYPHPSIPPSPVHVDTVHPGDSNRGKHSLSGWPPSRYCTSACHSASHALPCSWE